ncbi:MAG: ribonuclease H-like YkuK family protein [Flavobacteriales bacterium]
MENNGLGGFQRMLDGSAVDVLPHLRAVLSQHRDVEVLVGSDSQNRARHTVYTTTVVLRFRGNGAQVLFRRERAPKVTDLWTRLWGEVERSLAVAQALRDPGRIPVDRIDMDLNSDARFGSHKLHTAAVGFIKAHGYEPYTKPDLLIASWAADVLCSGSLRKHETPTPWNGTGES